MSREMALPAEPAERRAKGCRTRAITLALTSLACVGALLTLAATSAAAVTITELPVAFQVKNTDTSKAPCNSGNSGNGNLGADGATYTIRGHITGPQSALTSGKARGITMYLFGYEAGEWNWDLKAVPGYDYAAEMARLGHVSLTLDELGYGASGHPANGNETCQGAEADITHQIIQKLRNGAYTLPDAPSPKYQNVVLAGHDVGGEVAEIEAYSWKDISGLILVTYADQGFTPYIIKKATEASFKTCGESATGYVHYVSEEEFRTLLFYGADPQVIEAADALRNLNPCGIVRSTPPDVQIDKALLSQVTVPVLIVFGNNDTLVWTRQGEEEQERNFSGSHDKRTVFIPEAGHFVMFAKTAPLFDSTMSAWLSSRFETR